MKQLVMAAALASAVFGAQAQASEADRAAKRAEIQFYTTQYVGDDIAYENVGCKAPVFPEHSATKKEISAISEQVTAWRSCYNSYAERLAALHPAGKAIPADVQRVMTREELEMAKLRMAKVYDAVAADADDEARKVLAANDAWMKSTNDWVMQEKARDAERQAQLQKMFRGASDNSSIVSRAAGSAK